MSTKETTKLIQTEVGVNPDGIWGPNSANAVAKALGIGKVDDDVLLWYPNARTDFNASVTRGTYAHNYPQGAIVHFTCGWWNRSLDDQVAEQVENRYTYFVIDENGRIAQNFPLNEWGYHAGKSYMAPFGSSVSQYLVGIEICCAGKLEKDETPEFTNITFPEKDKRRSDGEANIKKGVYQKYTAAQEAALETLLLWLHENNPNVFKLDYVFGHDEVSPDRKSDPGASLSMTMPEFRAKLKGLV